MTTPNFGELLSTADECLKAAETDWSVPVRGWAWTCSA